MDYTQVWTLANDGTIAEIGIRLNAHMQRMVLSPDGAKHRKALHEARTKVEVKKKEIADRAAKESEKSSSDQLQRQRVPCNSCGKKRVAVQSQKAESK